jgi:GNAT superfamily N-acetyltransferase
VTSIQVVPYDEADRPELFRLMREVWGSYLSDEEWDWWFSGRRLITLARDDGRVVGVACMSFYRVHVDGEELEVPVPLHVATDPAYRGRGIFARLEEENERRAADEAPVALTFPNAASRRVFVGRLGWSDLRWPRVWVTLARGRAPRGVEVVREFGPEADELWRRVAPLYGNGLVRDRRYLNRRFAESPRDYTCLAADDGAAVVGRRTTRGVTVAYLAELVAAPGAATRRLVRAALASARAPILLALPPRGELGDLLRLGFAPTTKRVLVMAKALSPAASVPARWSFSLGDGDSW